MLCVCECVHSIYALIRKIEKEEWNGTYIGIITNFQFPLKFTVSSLSNYSDMCSVQKGHRIRLNKVQIFLLLSSKILGQFPGFSQSQLPYL